MILPFLVTLRRFVNDLLVFMIDFLMSEANVENHHPVKSPAAGARFLAGFNRVMRNIFATLIVSL